MADEQWIAMHRALYEKHAHRIQTAIAGLIAVAATERPPILPTSLQPKHLRTGLDLSKSDMAGLANLLIGKGIITMEEYVAAMSDAAEVEADQYEKLLQSILSNRNIKTG